MPIFYENKSVPIEVYALFEDITERKLAEQALRDADRQKDDSSDTVRMSFENPLAPIRTPLRSSNWLARTIQRFEAVWK